MGKASTQKAMKEKTMGDAAGSRRTSQTENKDRKKRRRRESTRKHVVFKAKGQNKCR